MTMKDDLKTTDDVYVVDPGVTDSVEITRQGDRPDDEAMFISQRYQRFLRAERAVQPHHEKFNMLDKFDRGEQWVGENIPPWIPKPVTNYIRYVRTLKRANLAANIPAANLSPYYPDLAVKVQMLQQGLDHVWECEHVPRIVRRCIDRTLLHGTAIAYVYLDENFTGGRYYERGDVRNNLYKGAIRVKCWSIANWFPDPDAYCVEDCKYMEFTEQISMNRVKNNPAFRKFAGDKLDTLKGNEVDYDPDANGEIYDNRTAGVTNNQTGVVTGDEMLTLHIHLERYMDDSGNWHMDISYYIKNNNFLLYFVKDAKPGVYPIGVLYDEEEDNSILGSSTAMDSLENQKVVNKVDQIASIIGVLNQNPQKIVSRESGINAQDMARTGTLPGKVWVSNIEPSRAVHTEKPTDIPRGLFEIQDRKTAHIKDTAGVNEVYQGNSVGSLTTSSGVRDLMERATMRDKDKMVQIDAFVEQISRLILYFMMYHWKQQRPIPTTNKNGTVNYQNWEPIDPKDIDNIMYMMKSEMYAHSPINAQNKAQAAQEMLQAQGQYNFNPPVITPEEYIQMKDFPNSKDIIARMNEDRKLAQQQQSTAAGALANLGDISFNVSSKDPKVVQATLQEVIQAAKQKAQQAQQMGMLNSDLAVGGGVLPQGSTPDQVPIPQNQAQQGMPTPQPGGGA